MAKQKAVRKSTLRYKTLNLALITSLVGSMFAPAVSNVAHAADEGKIDIAVQTDGVQIDGEFIQSTILLYEDGQADNNEVELDASNNFKHTYENRDAYAKYELKSELDEALAETYESIVTGDKHKGFTVYNLEKEFLEGSATIMYVDEDGNEIAKQNKQSGKIGDSYTTAPKKITGYAFKAVGNDVDGDIDEDTGIINANYAYGNTVVKYVYERTVGEEKAEGLVIVRYAEAEKDSEGNLVEDDQGHYIIKQEIAIRDEHSGEIGEDIQETVAKEIHGYKLIGQSSYEGTYEEGIREITFFYEEDESVTDISDVKGGVIVKFVDTNGNEIAPRIQEIGNIAHQGKNGQVEADTYKFDIAGLLAHVDGYGLVSVNGSLEGAFQKGFQEIVLTFDKSKDEIDFEDFSDVHVRYVDENGRDIHARDHFFERIGSEYATNAKKIEGYTLKEVKGEPSGTFGSETIYIEYVYTKNGSGDQNDVVIYGGVTAKYVDENGRDISNREEIEGRVGDSYETTEKNIVGYELQTVRGNAKGVIGEGIYTIEYVYVRVEEDAPEVDENEATEDDEVTEGDEKEFPKGDEKEDPKGEDNKTPEDNKIPEGVATVRIVGEGPYSHEVRYVDTDGNTINTIIYKGESGDVFYAEKQEIDGYAFVDFDGPTMDDTGKSSIATYKRISQVIYEKVEVDIDGENVRIVGGGPLEHEVRYVDTDGNLIHTIIYKGNYLHRFYAEKQVIDGYEFVKFGGKLDKDGRGFIDVFEQVSEVIYEKVDVDGTDEDDNNDPIVEDDNNDPIVEDDNNDPIVEDDNNDPIVEDDNNDPIVEDLLSYQFATDIVEKGLSIEDITKEFGAPTSTDMRGSIWIDDAGNMLLAYASGGNTISEVIFFDAERHEVTTDNLSDFYDSVKYGDTLNELNERVNTDGAQDMYISADGTTLSVWVSENLHDVMTVSFNEYGEANNKSLMTADGRVAFAMMSEDDVDGQGDGNGDNIVDVTGQKAEEIASGVNAEGKPLADTATNMYNMIAAGVALLAAAGGALFFINRKRTSEEAE